MESIIHNSRCDPVSLYNRVKMAHRNWVDSYCVKGEIARDEKWTSSIVVGSQGFIQCTISIERKLLLKIYESYIMNGNGIINLIILLLKSPISIILIILGTIFLLISIGVTFRIPFVKNKPIKKDARIIGIIIVSIGIILNVTLLIVFPPPPQENCQYIQPIITSPTDQSDAINPLTIKGAVKNKPQKKDIWLMIYNQNLRKYCDCIDIVPDAKNKWEREISLTCGKMGDAYDIYLCIVDLNTSSELEKFRSKESTKIPELIKKCDHIEVKLKY